MLGEQVLQFHTIRVHQCSTDAEVGIFAGSPQNGRRTENRNVREDQHRSGGGNALQRAAEPIELGFVELASVAALAGGRLVDAVEHDELPAGLRERVVALVEMEHVGGAVLAPVGLAAGGLALFFGPTPNVVVADAGANRDSAIGLQTVRPQVPLQCSASVVGLEAVHDMVAAGENQVRLVVELLDVMQAGGQALARAALGLNVDVGEMGNAERPLASAGLAGGQRPQRRGGPGPDSGRGGAHGGDRLSTRDMRG